MLQIISGKFFQSEKRYKYQGKGILFGNYTWYEPVETCVATLEPVDIIGSVVPYVVSYINQIEKPDKTGNWTLLRTGDAEIVEQFRLLCTFCLKAYFHLNRESVAIACRKHPLSMSDCAPSTFVPGFFQTSVRGTAKETAAFSSFVEKVIGLPRDTYRAVMAALKGFAYALEITGHNLDLAYSLLVFALECLSQRFDDYSAIWEDYPDETTKVLDPILRKLPRSTSSGIRRALLRDKNLRLQKRFIEFITDHIDRSFFIEEAPKTGRALRKAELARALRNAYQMRSAYTHQLEPIHELLRTTGFADGDVIHWKNEPYLTLAGLVRVVHHAISSFVRKQKIVEKEDIDWRSQLPGVIHVSIAPQYWIWKHEGFEPKNATSKLEGFLQQVESALVSGKSLTDLRDLMAIYEKLLPSVQGIIKLRMFALYSAYNLLVHEDGRTPDHEDVIAKYEDLFDECSIEAMLVLLILEREWPWESKALVKQWNLYMKQRYRRRGLAIPPQLELLVQVEIANAYLKAGSKPRHSMWLGRALLEAAGKPNLQALIREAQQNRAQVSRDSFRDATHKDLEQQK
ncbi:hypothetical protein KAX17_01620 [Candidatus Bipolaricaulota bacterium]|nr:hypothetical protein [Candidatus Bipolaricaulota bacterium]